MLCRKMISKWSLLGLFVGLVFTLLSAIRYFVVYPDFDKFIAYTSIGFLIMAVSWLYWRELDMNNKLTAMEEYLVDSNENK